MITQIAGIPCRIEVTSYTPYQPARLDGAIEDAEKACEGEIVFIVYNHDGTLSPWLAEKLKKADYDRIFDEYEETLTEEN
jgi:hypothetical protein